MKKALISNLRSVRTQKAFPKVQMLSNFHKFSFIALLEPFQRANQIQKYKKRLKMSYVGENYNGEIWIFCQGIDRCGSYHGQRSENHS